MHRVSQLVRSVSTRYHGARKTLVVSGFLAATLVGAGASTPAMAQGSSFRYHTGYAVEGNWLCFGWSDGSYHCTRHWYRADGGFVTRSSWVPGSGHANVTATHTTRSAPVHSSAPVRNTGYANPGTAGVVSEIQAVFGPYSGQALAIARCESGYNPNAYNPTPVGGAHAEGVFQILGTSTWYTTSYASQSPYNAWANIHAAYEIFRRDGYSWREWQCRA